MLVNKVAIHFVYIVQCHKCVIFMRHAFASIVQQLKMSIQCLASGDSDETLMGKVYIIIFHCITAYLTVLGNVTFKSHLLQ